jgi:hypothetical protein
MQDCTVYLSPRFEKTSNYVKTGHKKKDTIRFKLYTKLYT